MTIDVDSGDLLLLRESFQVEAGEIITALTEALLTLEERPEDAELVSVLFRGVHTVKGNARMVGIDHVGEFAHAFEDLLDAVRSRRLEVDPDLISFFLRVVDTMKEMIAEAAAGTDELTDDHRALLAEIAGRTPDKNHECAPAGDPAAEPAAENESASAAHTAKTLRVAITKLDRIMDLVGEISIARGRVSEIISTGSVVNRREALEVHHEADQLYMDLQELVMQMRMVPVGPLFREYVRAVRDFAMESGKGVRLYLEGEDVEVDTTVVEHLRSPLTHLVRNALNHGIEDTQERLDRGKPPVGRITLRAYHESGTIVVQLEDDGQGMNRDKIRRRAQEMGLVTESETLPDQQLLGFIFRPGFSTADEVTEISGRGVGMDVVRKSIELLRGTVMVDSREGLGTTITIRLPLTLAIIDGFRVGVGDETYVVPLDSVVECVERPEDNEADELGFGVINLRNQPLPFIRLRNLFNLGGDAPDKESILIVRHDGREVGFAVDRLLGESQTVIKPLNKLIRGLPGMTGSSILGNGTVAFILDVPCLLDQAYQRQQERVA